MKGHSAAFFENARHIRMTPGQRKSPPGFLKGLSCLIMVRANHYCISADQNGTSATPQTFSLIATGLADRMFLMIECSRRFRRPARQRFVLPQAII
jgi:hypothetical protein